jgi:hypothetical protein
MIHFRAHLIKMKNKLKMKEASVKVNEKKLDNTLSFSDDKNLNRFFSQCVREYLEEKIYF